MRISVYKIPMASPADASGLDKLIASGEVDPSTIVAVIGKTEGNGGANDFTRGFATLSLQLLLARHLRVSADEISERVAFVWSGGTEGVLSPHATVFTRTGGGDGRPQGLALGIEVTRTIQPEEVGTMAQVDAVAEAVRKCLAQTEVDDASDVHYVQVKGPLLSPAGIADADRRGKTVVTRDPNGSKSLARGAMALGVAVGLGEVDEKDVSDAVIGKRLDLYSSVASTSAGGELTKCEVLLFGNSSKATGDFRIGHAILRDVIDADGVRAALRNAGIDFEYSPVDEQAARIAAVFAKAEASPTGQTRGWRHTMLSDADITYERHARAVLGGVIASVTGDPAIFVSGGTEHQCPPGEAPIAAIVRAN